MATDPRLERSSVLTVTPPPPPPPPRESTYPQSSVLGYDGAADGNESDVLKAQEKREGFKLKFCTVCASNQNRYDRSIQVLGLLRLFFPMLIM